MVDVKPVWISSVKHLEKFVRILQDRSFNDKYIKENYNIPDEFPFLPSRIPFRAQRPIVFFSQGTLSIEPEFLMYRGEQFERKWMGTTIKFINLKDDLEFPIYKNDIKMIERFPTPSMPLPAASFMGPNWIRIKTVPDILNGDLLICIGVFIDITGKKIKMKLMIYTI